MSKSRKIPAPKKASKGKAKPVKAKAQQTPAMGRPTLYKPEYAEQVFKFCLLGATDEEIADFFAVTVATINNWKREHPDFFASIQRGKIQADAEIAHSLYNRAKGFEVEVEREVGKGDDKRIVKRKVRVEADVTALQFWMKNRHPKKWRDTKQVEVGGPGEFDDLSTDELRRQIMEDEEALAAFGLYEATAGSDSIN